MEVLRSFRSLGLFICAYILQVRCFLVNSNPSIPIVQTSRLAGEHHDCLLVCMSAFPADKKHGFVGGKWPMSHAPLQLKHCWGLMSGPRSL